MLPQSSLPPLKAFVAALVCAGIFLVPGVSAQDISAQPVSLSEEQTQTLGQAMGAYQAGQYERAITLADTVLKSNPEQGKALHIRASSRVELGIQTGNGAMIRDGVADAQKSIGISQSKLPAYYLPYLFGMTNLSMVENKEEHVKVSINIATQVLDRLEMKPDDRANILYQRGIANLQLNDTIDLGIADFKAALNLEPKHIPSLTAVADTYAMAGKNEDALAAFNQFVKVHPGMAIAYNNRGMFFKQLDRKEEALADFSAAVKIEPKFFVGIINHGYMLLELGRASEAEADFNNALTLQPENPSVIGLRANARLRQGKPDAAIADYQKAIKIFPKNPMTHADLGFAYFYQKKYAEAYQEFDAAINLNGKMRFLNPWTYAAMILSGKGQEANSRFAGTVAKPESERDWIDLLTLYLMGKIDQEKMLTNVNPEDAKAANAQRCEGYYFAGLRTGASGDVAGAKALFRKCIETKASYLSAYRAAQYELGLFQK